MGAAALVHLRPVLAGCTILPFKPIIKKSTLDPENMKNYRPVSNLAYIGKTIEKVVVDQLDAHLTDNDLHEPL